MSAYEEILDLITSSPTLEQIVTFELSETAYARVQYLEEREQANLLSKGEQSELRDFQRAADFMNQLIVRAQRRLGDSE